MANNESLLIPTVTKVEDEDAVTENDSTEILEDVAEDTVVEDVTVEDAEDEVVEDDKESKSELDIILDRVLKLEAERDEWKTRSRQHERSAKNLQRKEAVRSIMAENNLPAEAEELLSGENLEDIKVKAEKLSRILGDKQKETVMFSPNPFQAVKTEVQNGENPFQAFLANKLKK